MKVAEKFTSINGEGTRAGELAVFVRFKGCNTCDAVIVILCGLMNLSAHITRKPQKKY